MTTKPKSCIDCPVFEKTKKGIECKAMPSLEKKQIKGNSIAELYKNCPIDWDEGEKNGTNKFF